MSLNLSRSIGHAFAKRFAIERIEGTFFDNIINASSLFEIFIFFIFHKIDYFFVFVMLCIPFNSSFILDIRTCY